jgi:outer membrane lipoprotein LolB
MLNEALGWNVPLESLRAWLLGLPASPDDSYTLDPQGRLLTIDSQGWTIEYKRYSEISGQGMSLSLPSKFELRRSEISLRLVIDRWTF